MRDLYCIILIKAVAVVIHIIVLSPEARIIKAGRDHYRSRYPLQMAREKIILFFFATFSSIFTKYFIIGDIFIIQGPIMTMYLEK